MSTRLEEDFLLAAQINNCFKLKNLLHHGVNIDCVNDVSDVKLMYWLKLLFCHAEGPNCLAYVLFQGPCQSCTTFMQLWS